MGEDALRLLVRNVWQLPMSLSIPAFRWRICPRRSIGCGHRLGELSALIGDEEKCDYCLSGDFYEGCAVAKADKEHLYVP